MDSLKERLDREVEGLPISSEALAKTIAYARRRSRNQRITAGVVGSAVFVAAVWVVTSVGSFDDGRTSVGPAGDVTEPVETGPAETGPTEIGQGGQGSPWSLPVSVTDYLVDIETGARTPLPESIVGTEDVTSAYAVSPDGSRLAYVRRGDEGGVGIFVANLDGTGVQQVTVGLRGDATPSGAAAPAWSPDGSRIAYVGRGGPHGHGDVYLLDLATGVFTQVTDDPRGATSPTFTPDGSSIIYSADRERAQILAVVPVAGGASVPLLGDDGTYSQQPALSPDGSLLAYVCGDGAAPSTGICLANADGSGARVFVPMTFAEYPKWSPDGTRIAFWNWQSGVYVVDVATGEVTTVDEGAEPTWLDGYTIIVEADGCSLPPHGRCPG